MPDFAISPWDITILIAYVVGTRIAFGWYFALKTRGQGAESYFLAGRSIRWPIIGLSFYVANMSGSTFVGLPGSGYHTGVSVYDYEWLPAIILIVFCIFVLPSFLRSKIYTAPEFLERRYGPESRIAFSAFLLLANLFVDAAAALYAGAMIVETIYPPFTFSATVAFTAAAAGIYIFFGGLGAVVLNDVLQAILILVGSAVLTFLAWSQVPSWDAVRDAAPPNAFHLIQPANDDFLPWPGLVTGVLVIGFYFWCTNQFIIQRTLAAKSLDHARWGSLFAGFLKLPNLFILVLPGVMATQIYPDLERPDLVFPTLAFGLLPVGWRGLMLAALAAAILSSLEAIFNSASTLLTMDFVRTFRPQTSDRALARWGRWSTLGFMVASALWAPVIRDFPTLWDYLQSILAYTTPPAVVVFLFGLLWPRASRVGGFLTLAVGIPLGIVGWLLVEIVAGGPIQFLYACGIMFGIACGLHASGSLLWPGRQTPEQQACLWRPDFWREETRQLQRLPWWQNYRVQSVLLAALTLAIVVWWW